MFFYKWNPFHSPIYSVMKEAVQPSQYTMNTHDSSILWPELPNFVQKYYISLLVLEYFLLWNKRNIQNNKKLCFLTNSWSAEETAYILYCKTLKSYNGWNFYLCYWKERAPVIGLNNPRSLARIPSLAFFPILEGDRFLAIATDRAGVWVLSIGGDVVLINFDLDFLIIIISFVVWIWGF